METINASAVGKTLWFFIFDFYCVEGDSAGSYNSKLFRRNFIVIQLILSFTELTVFIDSVLIWYLQMVVPVFSRHRQSENFLLAINSWSVYNS